MSNSSFLIHRTDLKICFNRLPLCLIVVLVIKKLLNADICFAYSPRGKKIRLEKLSLQDLEQRCSYGPLLTREKSAAAIFCQLKHHRNQTAHFMDVLGVVAILGKTNNENLSRYV